MSPAFVEFRLIKATATGNDFLIADLLDTAESTLWNKEFGGRPRADWVKTWCDRYTGLGADGVVILEPAAGLDFAWDFYNSDGSAAEMCGNAARAVSLYVARKTGRRQLKFRTRAGEITAVVHNSDDVEIHLPKIKGHEFGGEFDFVMAGVPHAVVKCGDLSDETALTKRALEIRRLEKFKRDGTNVTFLKTINDEHIQTKTFERGVDGFTRSCGTGAVAAAFAVLRGKEGVQVSVDVPGGRLSVVWKNGAPILRGPARITGEMRWAREGQK